jgi:hypothetical protein
MGLPVQSFCLNRKIVFAAGLDFPERLLLGVPGQRLAIYAFSFFLSRPITGQTLVNLFSQNGTGLGLGEIHVQCGTTDGLGHAILDVPNHGQSYRLPKPAIFPDGSDLWWKVTGGSNSGNVTGALTLSGLLAPSTFNFDAFDPQTFVNAPV